jgi:DNA-binding MarR family transcriptional regulator
MRARRPGGAPQPHEVLREVRSYVERWNQSPTISELCDQLDCGRSTVQRALAAMERNGWVTRRKQIARSIVITPQGHKAAWAASEGV